MTEANMLEIEVVEPKKAKKNTSINKQMYRLLAMIIVPLLILVSVLLYIMNSFNSEYSETLQNANTAADFNNNFKKTLDLEMWNYVVRGKPPEELPWSEVNHAKEVLGKLKETTVEKDNRWRINSMLNMCENLSRYMIAISDAKLYDERIEILEKDIYSITGLIQTYMHDYIYDEVKNMTNIQTEIGRKVGTAVAATIVAFVIIAAIILLYSLVFTRWITSPITELCEKVEKLGKGDFSVKAIDTHSVEIKTLDDGFNNMVKRIDALMEKEIKDQNALHRAELELLQAQINPHFLYNTLESIIWLAESRRDKDVIKMVTNLSVFFRNSLSKGKDIITVEAEKNQVSSYLEIQQIRYSDILDYEIKIPDTMMGYYIPKLVLQPLTENALYHGIKHKRTRGKIVIIGWEQDDDIYISVEDNGNGMSEQQLRDLRAGIYHDNHSGLGLINVHKRIGLYCGEGYGLSFESTEGIGTKVTVKLPKEIQF